MRRKTFRRLYRLTAMIETTRRMTGSDEFLVCTAQRSGIKRKHMTANPVRVTVQEVRRAKK
jgi:hypothetical protein